MKTVIVRALVAVAGAAGLVAVTCGMAAAGASLNHSEPVLHQPGR
jgi:hypothetical protein